MANANANIQAPLDLPISEDAYKYQIRNQTLTPQQQAQQSPYLKDGRIQVLDPIDQQAEIQFLDQQIHQYFSNKPSLNGTIPLEERTNFDFIVELLDLSTRNKTCIIDYQNLEEKARDRPTSSAESYNPRIDDSTNLGRAAKEIKFRIPIVLILKWAIANNIKNIIIISKRNIYINPDITQIINGQSFSQNLSNRYSPKYLYNVSDLQAAIRNLNIVHINVDGIVGNIVQSRTPILHDMRGCDDATILLITQILNRNIVGTDVEKKEDVIVLSNDTRMLDENYSYVPPFDVTYTAFLEGRQMYNNTFVFNTNLNPFFSQSDYPNFLPPFAEYYTRVPITNAMFVNFYFQPGINRNWWTEPIPDQDPSVNSRDKIAVLNSTQAEATGLLSPISPNVQVSEYYKKYLKYKNKYLQLKKRL